MTVDFQDELRKEFRALEERMTKQRVAIFRTAVVVLIGLVAHAFVAGGMWADLSGDVERNAEQGQANAEALKIVADEQLRRTQNVSAVGELKIELKAVREIIQSVRDDVLIMKNEQERKP